MKKAVIVLPTYNEQDNVISLIPRIVAICDDIDDWEISILVVDDNSPDKTFEAVKKLQDKFKRLHLISGPKQGLGRAYIRGFSYALANLSPDVIFEMDADWSHDPNLIPKFLGKIKEGTDFVVGTRYIKGGSIPKDWALHRKIFSYFGNFIIKYGFMSPGIHDWTSGYRAIKASLLPDVLEGMKNYNGYVFQVALLDKLKKRDAKIGEIPLKFVDRKAGESKINSLQFILNTLSYVFFHSSFIKYLIVGVIGFIIDFGLSFFLIELARQAIWFSTVISAETAIISNFLLNNFWSFSHKRISPGFSSYLKSFANFNFVSLGSILIQTVSLSIATIVFPRHLWYLYKALIIIFLVIPYSYFMYTRFIWKTRSAA